MLDITEQEKEQMREWIAYNTIGYQPEDINLTHTLDHWREAKSHYLYKLMDECLIRTIPAEIDYPIELSERTQSDIFALYDLLENAYQSIAYNNPHELLVYDAINTIFNNNVVLHQCAFPNSKCELHGICFHKGEKWYRSARKFIEKVCINLSQDIREEALDLIDRIQNQYSMTVQNFRKSSQKLTLSIHPLDYITMSDNECNWSSCMSWRNEGDYHAGTIEMMNSTCVVVAYIAQNNETLENGWNSKRWRQLFVIHPTCIIASCPYPGPAQQYTDIIFKKFGLAL